MARKKYRKPPMIPGASQTMHQMRFEIAKKLNYIDPENPPDDWWERMTPMQQSTVNGQVTKLLIMKAQSDMLNGNFRH